MNICAACLCFKQIIQSLVSIKEIDRKYNCLFRSTNNVYNKQIKNCLFRRRLKRGCDVAQNLDI